MIEGFEGFLTTWLGDAKAVGASSWLHWFSWIAALLIAASAWFAIRRQSLQSRATLLLSLYGQWEMLSTQRKTFNAFLRKTKHEVLQQNATKKEADQKVILRNRYTAEMEKMRAEETAEFFGFMAFVSFFELIGTYVRKGYLPLGDVRLIYKGPVLDMELAASDFIQIWQSEAHVPRGLLENAKYLMSRMREREDHPIRYYLISRWIQR